MSTRPHHMYEEDIAKVLQNPPFNWIGNTAYLIVKKYKAKIHELWVAEFTPEECSSVLNDLMMSKPQKIKTAGFLSGSSCIGVYQI